MSKRIILSEQDRARIEQYRKNASSAPYRKPITIIKKKEQSKPSVAPFQKDEEIYAPMLELLLMGMRRGSQTDKVALESLLQTLFYRSVSTNFTRAYQRKYEETLPIFNTLYTGNTNLPSLINDGKIAMEDLSRVTQRLNGITQRISGLTQRLIPPNPDNPS